MSFTSYYSSLDRAEQLSVVLTLTGFSLPVSALTKNWEIDTQQVPLEDLTKAFEKNQKVVDTLVSVASGVLGVVAGYQLYSKLKSPGVDAVVDPDVDDFSSFKINALENNTDFLEKLTGISAGDFAPVYDLDILRKSSKAISQGYLFYGKYAFDVAQATVAGTGAVVIDSIEEFQKWQSTIESTKRSGICIFRNKSRDITNLATALKLNTNFAGDYKYGKYLQVIFTHEDPDPTTVGGTPTISTADEKRLWDAWKTPQQLSNETHPVNVDRTTNILGRLGRGVNCSEKVLDSDKVDSIRQYHSKTLKSVTVPHQHVGAIQWVKSIKFLTPFLCSGVGAVGLIWALYKLGRRYIKAVHLLTQYYTLKDVHCVRGTRWLCKTIGNPHIVLSEFLSVEQARQTILKTPGALIIWCVRPSGELRPTTAEINRAVQYYS